MRGGMEAVFDDLDKLLGMSKFAPMQAARRGMFSAGQRAHLPEADDLPAPPLLEDALYGKEEPA